jgi:hypothetical protein
MDYNSNSTPKTVVQPHGGQIKISKYLSTDFSIVGISCQVFEGRVKVNLSLVELYAIFLTML